MRIHIIGCRVLTRELSALIPSCPNIITVSWLPQGMHDTPEILHASIQEELARIYDQIDRRLIRQAPDYIAMGYGLCSKATVGLEATRIPLVVPRTDDCIALFLGSQERYMDYFTNYPGTYWFNSDWIESVPDIQPGYYEELRERYMEEYEDEDTVDYLMDMEEQMIRNYNNVGFINTTTHDCNSARLDAQSFANRMDLNYMEIDGDTTMLQKMVLGDFDPKDFLVVEPGYKVEYSNGPERMVAVPAV